MAPVRNRFVGRGIGFPMRTNAAGGLATVTDEVEISESIRLVLGTAYGERPMRPDFGCAIHDRIFDPMNGELPLLVEQDVRAALERWEPRVSINDVRVVVDTSRPGTLLIDVGYTISGTNDQRNLVFPFYNIPPSEE